MFLKSKLDKLHKNFVVKDLHQFDPFGNFFFVVGVANLSMTSVKIPKCPNDITKEWLKNLIKSTDCTIMANDKLVVTRVDAVTEKIGYLSVASRAKVEVNDQTKHLFIKTILGPDDPLRWDFSV